MIIGCGWMKKKNLRWILDIFIIFILLEGYLLFKEDIDRFILKFKINHSSYQLEEIPTYSGIAYVKINNNKPNFNEEDYQLKTFEKYSDLDYLGRAGVAFANVGKDLMPTEERGSISGIKPSGWQTVKYDHIDGKYLYNRCHLIGYQLTGENANPKNLITCTREMNTVGMLELENKVAKYIKETNNHVLYRVTPIYQGNNLVASGVQIEASSVEDKCGKICFNIYVYNNQPGININYATGDSSLE